MASGNTLAVFSPLHHQPPASTYALLGSRNSHPTLEFDAATAWDAIFGALLPRNYSGNGITLTLVWAAASATSGNCKWQAAFERLQDGTDSIGSDSFAAAQSVTDAAPGTSGVVKYSTISFSDSQIDGLQAGEAYRLKVTRAAADVADTMTGNAQLLRVEVKET